MEDTMANTILKELREFRAENNKRWEANDKRWEENDRRWEANTKTLVGMSKRISALEEGRKKDRREIIEILDTMQKSIDNQLTEMREHFDAKFEKIFTLQRLNDIEHDEFKKLLYTHEKRINFQSARIKYLEEWKNQFDMGEFTAV